jgi:hypothetical protein
MFIATLKPWLTPPRTFSTGTGVFYDINSIITAQNHLKIDRTCVRAADTQLILWLPAGQATEGALDNEGSDMVLSVISLGLSKHCNVSMELNDQHTCHDLCKATVADPDLGAVEEIVLAVSRQCGAGLDVSSIASSRGLSQSEGGNVLSSGKLGKVLALLCLVSVEQNALKTDRLRN